MWGMCLNTGYKWYGGTMRGWGGVVWGGGERETDSHSKNEQTTKKWVAGGTR